MYYDNLRGFYFKSMGYKVHFLCLSMEILRLKLYLTLDNKGKYNG
jgi:hypothetical protein